MRVGIIRCQQTEDYCPGTTDFRMIREKKGAFEGIEEEIEIVGFINCGGCPAKKAVLRARELVKRGADTIVFASCTHRLALSLCQEDERDHCKGSGGGDPVLGLYTLTHILFQTILSSFTASTNRSTSSGAPGL